MSSSRTWKWVIAAWGVTLGSYAVARLVLPPGHTLNMYGDIVQSLVPLLANAGLLMNAGTPHWRRNFFWMLLAAGCSLWMIGQVQWAYSETYVHRPASVFYSGDILIFLRGIPVMAALTLQPHKHGSKLRLGVGSLDFGLLLLWWVFLYAFVVLPWMYASPSLANYNYSYACLSAIQDFVIVGFMGAFWLSARGAWRTLYGHLFGATSLYMLGTLLKNVAITLGRYHAGSPMDLMVVASFLWLGTAGVVIHGQGAALDASAEESDGGAGSEGNAGDSQLTAELAMAAVLSLPLFALWALRYSHNEDAVRDFRLLITLVAMVPLAFLAFLRQHLANVDRNRLLTQSEEALGNLRRLQAQLVQSEKLASLGQLAAGAAHEINNPLTAILGYSELLAEDHVLPEHTRTTAGKIRDQARRTKVLVANLLSFARQVPPERTLLDINTVVSNALQLRSLDKRGMARIETQLEPVLPGVRGDASQLTQVFFNIIKNGLDAMEGSGGVLTIKTMRDRASVVVLFSDTGPGLKDPNRVFDPFYTTKPVGKGTGLGLSICYGLVQEHGGRITCYNRQEGGAVFRIDLPAVTAKLPGRELQPTRAAKNP